MTTGSDLGGMAALGALAGSRGTGFGSGMGHAGAALGATGTVLGGLALLSNLGRNGGLFGGGVAGADTTGMTNAMQLNTIQAGVSDIKAAVPLSAAQTNNTILQQTGLVMAGQAAIGAIISAEMANLKDAANMIGFQNMQATNQNGAQNLAATNANGQAGRDATNNVNQNVLIGQYQTQAAITTDGDRTRALIQSIQDANLQRQLTVAESALFEERNRFRSREVEVNVSQAVTQTQNNLQAQAQFQAQQQQQQQQLILLAQIASGLGNVTQLAHATNANLLIGNTGASTIGAQTAAPVNVNAPGF